MVLSLEWMEEKKARRRVSGKWPAWRVVVRSEGSFRMPLRGPRAFGCEHAREHECRVALPVACRYVVALSGFRRLAGHLEAYEL